MEHPTNLMTITGVFTFDGPFGLAEARGLAERLLRFDRFRQRVVTDGPLGRPSWVVDAEFDLANHVFAVEAQRGTDDHRALETLVGELMSAPLDYARPLWQFHVATLPTGAGALVARVHHCIADGMSLVQVLLHIADEPPLLPAFDRTANAGDAARGLVGRRGLVSAARATGTVAAALARIADLRPDPRTPLRGRLGVTKRAVWSRPLALDAVRQVGKAHGATINDVLLSTVAGALGRYLASRGAAADVLRAVVPVNLRRPGDVALGNKFGMVFLPLPVGVRDASERLRMLKTAMDEIKRSPEAVIIFGLLRAFGRTTTRLLRLAVNLLGGKATTVMTNVPGPREPIRFVGRVVDTLMFWVPQSGKLGMGVSILSYCGQVRVGVATDVGLVPDPERIVDAFEASFEELRAATAR